MSWRKYTIDELLTLLDVNRECFHREIKIVIKADFKKELKNAGYDNPDILLDDDYIMALADPRDNTVYFETEVNIFDYL